MKKIFILIYIVILSQSNYFPQSFWLQCNGPYGGTVKTLYLTKNKSLYAGTWEGLFFSKNNGSIWTKVFDKNVNTIKETKDGRIYIGTTSVDLEKTLFYSDDDGGSWNVVESNPEEYSITAIESDKKGNVYLGTYNNGLLKSTDNGNSWLPINDGLINTSITSLKSLGNNILLVGTEGGGIHKSTNFGNNWVEMNSGINNLEINCISYDGKNDIVVATEDGLYIFNEKNNSWFKIFQEKVLYSLFNIKEPIYISTQKGIYSSTNKGKDWISKNDGLRNINTNVLLLTPKGVLAGTEKAGIFITNDKGNLWKSSNTGLSNLWVTSIATNSHFTVFIGSQGSGIFKSTDNGISWLSINNGLANLNVNDITIGLDDELFIATTNGIYKSSNEGVSWQKENIYVDDFDDNIKKIIAIDNLGLNHLIIGSLDGIVISSSNYSFYEKTFPSKIDLIYNLGQNILIASGKALSVSNQLYLSNDRGRNWKKINEGYDKLHFWTISSGSDGKLYAGTNQGILISLDQGKNWQSLYTGMTEYFDWGQRTYSLVLDILVLNNKEIYASFDGKGIYYSEDGGNNWISKNAGIEAKNFSSIVKNDNGYIFIGTTSNGVYRSALKVE